MEPDVVVGGIYLGASSSGTLACLFFLRHSLYWRGS